MTPTTLLTSACAGSPSPVGDSEDFDLASYLIRHPHDTFYIRVSGDSMRDAGINHGDLLIVDKAIDPRPSDIVVAQVGDGFTVKTYQRELGRLCLVPANPDFKPIDLSGHEDARICGVAVFAIHRL